jgi:ADP-ribose pyrophosphatase YjhB (NUDIX family)
MTDFLLKFWKILKLPTNLQLFFMRRFNDQFLIGVTGVIFNEDKEVLLFKHTYRGDDSWSLPGGYIKAKEHPKEALEREIEEESGLIISADARLKLRTDRNSPRIDITYMGTFIGGEFKTSKEVDEAKFFKFNELPILPQDQLYFIEKASKNNITRY